MEPSSEIWLHLKSGGLYIIIAQEATIEETETPAVVYKSLTDGRVWVRPNMEFFDGRFHPVLRRDVPKIKAS